MSLIIGCGIFNGKAAGIEINNASNVNITGNNVVKQY